MRSHLHPTRFRQDQGVLGLACQTDTRRFHAGVGSLDLLRAPCATAASASGPWR